VGRPRSKNLTLSPLSQACRDLRRAAGRTQAQFAGDMGVSLPTIQRWEQNFPPSGATLVKLRQTSEALLQNCSVDVRPLLLQTDQVFYAALVDEFPVYRMGLVADIMVSLGEVRSFVSSVICDESIDARYRQGASLVADELLHIQHCVSLFDPIRNALLTEGSENE
jgi:transcriptional regulator with XRE-family HTH domain